jgi:hypothetical protein
MKENRNEVEIRATPEKVWAVLTDLDKYPDWNPLIYRAEGKVALGKEVNISAKTESNDLDLRCSVVKVEANREFSWKFHVLLPFLFRGEHIFRVEPIDEHHTRFIDREIFNGLLLPLQARDLETNAKAAMIAMGEALKRRVEQ